MTVAMSYKPFVTITTTLVYRDAQGHWQQIPSIDLGVKYGQIMIYRLIRTYINFDTNHVLHTTLVQHRGAQGHVQHRDAMYIVMGRYSTVLHQSFQQRINRWKQ